MAADDPVIFTEKDYELLKEMAADYLVSRNKSPNRPYYPERKPQAPEVYLAHVGAGGLPAFSPGADSGTGTGTAILDDTFGSATCSTWRRLDTGKVIEIGRNITVYNLTLTRIPQGSWILVVRDKSGTWWHDGGVGGAIEDYPLDVVSNVCLIDGTLTVEHTVHMALSGEILSTYCIENPENCCGNQFVTCPGECSGINYPLHICATITSVHLCDSIAGQYQLTYNSSLGAWVTAGYPSGHPAIAYAPCGASFSTSPEWTVLCGGSTFASGTIGSAPSAGQIPCSLPSTTPNFTLFTDCNGCPGSFSGDPGVINITFSRGVCSGNTGTGTGTAGGGGGTVSTPCCPAGLPTFLFLTITDVSGCACVAGTYQLAWDGTKWTFFGEGICGGLSFNASLLCSFGSWVLSVVCDLFGSTVTWTGTVDATCTFPIGLTNLSGIQSGPGPWCCTGNVSLTITE